MAAKVGTALEVASTAAITIGAAIVSTALGFVVGGALGLVFAWRLAR